MNVTPEMLYWVLIADNLKEAMTGIILLISIISFIAIMVTSMSIDNADMEEEKLPLKKFRKRWVTSSLGIIPILILVNSFIPSTNTLLIMYGGSAIINSDTANKLVQTGDKTLDVVNQKLDNWLANLKKEKSTK